MFEIKNVTKAKSEVTTKFYLEKTSCGEIALRAEDEDGFRWSVLAITKSGISLNAGVPKELGIGIDAEGYVNVETE